MDGMLPSLSGPGNCRPFYRAIHRMTLRFAQEASDERYFFLPSFYLPTTSYHLLLSPPCFFSEQEDRLAEQTGSRESLRPEPSTQHLVTL